MIPARSEVELAVLGPVVVQGAPMPFRRSAALELVVFLAFHRSGVRHAACALALWPDRPVSRSTVHSTASDARRALGCAVDGWPQLPRGSVLRLRETVVTDVDQFAALAASGDPDDVVRGMQLVRGPLFSGLRSTDWAVFDGTAAAVEALVVRAALQGAQALVRRGDPEWAEWVVRRALTLSPYDERLYRALLRATAAQGDCARLRSTMAQLRILSGEAPGPPWPAGARDVAAALHPQTESLYRDLLYAEPASGRHRARL